LQRRGTRVKRRKICARVVHILSGANKFFRFFRNCIDSPGLIYMRSPIKFAADSLLADSIKVAIVIRVQDIRSLTDFTRHAKDHLKRLKETGHPVVLTINGKAAVVVRSAEAYQRLLGAQERAKRDRKKKS